MTLSAHLMAYLDKNGSQWIPVTLLYDYARRTTGLPDDAIRLALTIIEHTIPYAVWSVSDTHHTTLNHTGITGVGKYYRKHHLTPTQHAMYKRSVEAFSALP